MFFNKNKSEVTPASQKDVSEPSITEENVDLVKSSKEVTEPLETTVKKETNGDKSKEVKTNTTSNGSKKEEPKDQDVKMKRKDTDQEFEFKKLNSDTAIDEIKQNKGILPNYSFIQKATLKKYLPYLYLTLKLFLTH